MASSSLSTDEYYRLVKQRQSHIRKQKHEEIGLRLVS